MNKKFLTESGLDSYVKKFNFLNEYSFIGQSPSGRLDEIDDEEEEPEAPEAPEQNPESAPQGGDVDIVPQQPEATPQDNGEQPGNPNQGDMMPQQPEGDEGFDMDEPPMDMPVDGGMEEGDEVIDIDELMDAQRGTEIKVDALTDKLDSIIDAVKTFEEIMNNTEAKLDDLKSALVRSSVRRSTDWGAERRLSAGAPFVKPVTEEPEESKPEAKSYDITAADIQNLDTPSAVEDVFNEPVKLNGVWNW